MWSVGQKKRMVVKEENQGQGMSRFSHESCFSQLPPDTPPPPPPPVKLPRASQAAQSITRGTPSNTSFWLLPTQSTLMQRRHVVGMTCILIQLCTATTGLYCITFSLLCDHTPVPYIPLLPAHSCSSWVHENSGSNLDAFNPSSRYSFYFLLWNHLTFYQSEEDSL